MILKKFKADPVFTEVHVNPAESLSLLQCLIIFVLTFQNTRYKIFYLSFHVYNYTYLGLLTHIKNQCIHMKHNVIQKCNTQRF